MARTCDILLSEVSFSDKTGCVLPDGHEGPHECRDEHGRSWNWETDLECGCEHCSQDEGDYCTTYWRKN